jgi:hypothetical protein
VGDVFRFSDVIVPQNAVNAFLLATTVVAPDGWTTRRVDDSQLWYVAEDFGNLQIAVDAPLTLMLDLVPPS